MIFHPVTLYWHWADQSSFTFLMLSAIVCVTDALAVWKMLQFQQPHFPHKKKLITISNNILIFNWKFWWYGLAIMIFFIYIAPQHMFSWRSKKTINPSLNEHNMTCLSKQCRSRSVGWSGSGLFVIKYVNFYQKPGSSYLTGWKLEVGVAS